MLQNCRMRERVKNIVAKREIAHYEQFLLLPQCFPKLLHPMCQNASAGGKALSNKNVKSIENLKIHDTDRVTCWPYIVYLTKWVSIIRLVI